MILTSGEDKIRPRDLAKQIYELDLRKAYYPNLSKKEIAWVVTRLTDVIIDNLGKEKRVVYTRLGTFDLETYVSGQTPQGLEYDGGVRMRFRPSVTLIPIFAKSLAWLRKDNGTKKNTEAQDV